MAWLQDYSETTLSLTLLRDRGLPPRFSVALLSQNAIRSHLMRWLGIMFLQISLGQALYLGAAEVGLIRIKGAIGPATADYISRATKVAAERKDECLIIQLDTP